MLALLIRTNFDFFFIFVHPVFKALILYSIILFSIFVFNGVLEVRCLTLLFYPPLANGVCISFRIFLRILSFVLLTKLLLTIDIMTCKFEKPSLWPEF